MRRPIVRASRKYVVPEVGYDPGWHEVGNQHAVDGIDTGVDEDRVDLDCPLVFSANSVTRPSSPTWTIPFSFDLAGPVDRGSRRLSSESADRTSATTTHRRARQRRERERVLRREGAKHFRTAPAVPSRCGSTTTRTVALHGSRARTAPLAPRDDGRSRRSGARPGLRHNESAGQAGGSPPTSTSAFGTWRPSSAKRVPRPAASIIAVGPVFGVR